jgi:hypothetical protein
MGLSEPGKLVVAWCIVRNVMHMSGTGSDAPALAVMLLHSAPSLAVMLFHWHTHAC